MSTWIYDSVSKTKTKVAGRAIDPALTYLTATDIDNLMQGAAAKQWSYLANLIIDDAVSLTKVWSSNKIDSELTIVLTNAKQYTDEQIAKFKTASYKLASSTAEMDNPSVLYLLPVTGSDYYDIYALVDDTPTAIGTTQVQLDDYYTKTNADNLFLKKADGIAKTRYESEIGDITDLNSGFDADSIVDAVNELFTGETTDIDFANDF